MCKSVEAFPDPRDNGSGGNRRILPMYISLNGSQPPFLFVKDQVGLLHLIMEALGICPFRGILHYTENPRKKGRTVQRREK